MNNTAVEHASAQRAFPEIVEALALEMRVPVDEVQRIFEEELLALKQGSRISQFLNVIACRKVRLRLRNGNGVRH